MGRRGPKPTPTAILKMRGSKRGEQNRLEPKPERRQQIKSPKFLSEEGRAVWKRVFPIVRNMQVMTIADVNSLGKYCDCFAQWEKLAKFLQENGHTYTVYQIDSKGNPTDSIHFVRKFPEADLYMKLTGSLTVQEQAFGLTPSARTRLTTTVPYTTPKHEAEQEEEKPRLLRVN